MIRTYRVAEDKSILLVEDHEPSLKVEAAFIRELGYQPDIAKTGREALEKFEVIRYPLVLIDIQIPEPDGLEATRQMRKLESINEYPPAIIIGMTGHATEDDELLCRKAGMNGYISKPFRLDELQIKLEEFK